MGSDAGSFHGADLMIVQGNDSNHESVFQDIDLVNKSQKRSLTESIASKIDENVALTDDNNFKFLTATSLSNASQYWEDFEQLNLIWLLQANSKKVSNEIFDQEEVVYHESLESDTENESYVVNSTETYKKLSWSAFHSKISEPAYSLCNVAIVAPLYRRSPTEIPILVDILIRAMNINALIVGKDGKTIITLDGDLYGRAVKVPNYKEKWIIRLGSLHTIIAALKCLGKYIEGSGIDTAWEISGIYGSATINQIIEGRHIYRGIHAHTITLIALHQLYSQSKLTAKEMQTLDSTIVKLETETQCGPEKIDFINSVLKMKRNLIEKGILEKLNVDKTSTSSGSATFLCNYMAQVMNMLNYIGATRNSKWLQHLATGGDMCKYFHAHDQRNYAKWKPLYLADMLELQTTDLDSWDFLAAGNFTVSKNKMPFTSIDPDHAIEHEHKPMKMKGGFTGIANNESALERFFLTAPILSNIANNFKSYSKIKYNRQQTQVHHELVGNFFANQLKQSQNLIGALSKEGNPFDYSDLRNLVSFSVPRNSVCVDVLKRDELGEKYLEKFRKERMIGKSKIPFWSPLKRNNLQMFSDNEVIFNNNGKKSVTSLKQEKLLYARMLLISKSRPELSPEKIIGDYEFTNIPPSNFTPDGTMIIAKSNESLIKLIQAMPASDSDCGLEINGYSTIIIDAMDIIDQIKKRKVGNVAGLANVFMSQLEKISQGYQEVRLIFSRFTPNSLKELCRQKRSASKKIAVQYHVNKNTPITNVESFMAHVKTRIEISEFLGRMVLQNFNEVKLLIAYGNKFFVNGPNVSLINGDHNLEESQHIILVNAIDANKNRLQNLAIKSQSIDALVLLVGFYHLIPPETTFIYSGESIRIGTMHSRSGEKLSKALIGWYAFQGMENQGAFFGKGITSHFKAFEKSDDDIISAFSNFGVSEGVPETVLTQMERYICILYGNNSEKSIKDGRDANQLPPTLRTLIPHVSSAYYNALIGKMAIEPCSEVPNPINYHWTFDEDSKYSPVMSLNPATPAELSEMKKCDCKSAKKQCLRLSCTCFKNGMKCCGLCGCGDDCENVPEDLFEINEGENLF